MKTKTKTNLKRALLFFIPLCLIAGMFAVPAFAALPFPENPTENQAQSHSISIYVGDTQQTVDVTGYYMIEVSGAVAQAALEQMYMSAYEGSFYVFGNNASDFYSGYVFLTYYDGGAGFRLTGEDDNGTIGSFQFRIGGDGSYDYRIGGTTSWVDFDSADVTRLRFYLPTYPPVLSEYATYFWSFSDYTVTHLVAGTPDPEPPADDGAAGDTSGIFAVWSEITDWIINGLTSATNAFYYNGQLTLLGYLCIIPLALGVALLLISIIQKFLRLRG